MAGEEKRTLSIIARVQDNVTGVMRTMGNSLSRIVRGTIVGSFNLMGTALRNVHRLVIGLAGAVGAAFLAFRAGGFITGVLESADALNKLASNTGTSVESISTMEKAFEFAGVAAEQYRAVLLGLGRSSAAFFNNPRSLQGDAFSRLGVTIDLLRRGDAVAIFGQIARGLESINTQAEKQAVLAKLFPDNFQRLTEVLGQGEAAFLKNITLAQSFGAALSSGLAEAATNAADDLLKLKIVITDLTREGIIRFADEMRPVIRALADFLRLNRDRLIEALATALELVGKAIATIVTAVANFLVKWPTMRTELSEMLNSLPVGLNRLGGLFDSVFDVDPLDKWRGRLQGILQVLDDLPEGDPRISGQDRAAQSLAGAHFPASPEAAIAAARKANELLKATRDLAGIFDGDGSIASVITVTADRLKGIGEAAEQVDGPLRQFWTNFKAGAVEGWEAIKNFAAVAQEAGKQVVNSLQTNLANTFDAIIQGTQKAGEAFHNFALGVLKDLSRIASEILANEVLKGIVSLVVNIAANTIGTSGKSTTNVGTSSNSGFGFGTALFDPNPGGGAGGGGGNVTNNYVTNNYYIDAVDGPSIQRMLSDHHGQFEAFNQNQVASNQDMRTALRGVR